MRMSSASAMTVAVTLPRLRGTTIIVHPAYNRLSALAFALEAAAGLCICPKGAAIFGVDRTRFWVVVDVLDAADDQRSAGVDPAVGVVVALAAEATDETRMSAFECAAAAELIPADGPQAERIAGFVAAVRRGRGDGNEQLAVAQGQKVDFVVFHGFRAEKRQPCLLLVGQRLDLGNSLPCRGSVARLRRQNQITRQIGAAGASIAGFRKHQTVIAVKVRDPGRLVYRPREFVARGVVV